MPIDAVGEGGAAASVFLSAATAVPILHVAVSAAAAASAFGPPVAFAHIAAAAGLA